MNDRISLQCVLSAHELDAVSGGYRYTDRDRQSSMFEDRRGQSSPFTPTEDGYLVGPRGEIYPDLSRNENQPVEPTHVTPTEDGYIFGPNGEYERDPSINMDQPRGELPQADREHLAAALNGQLSPTEDGYVVGPQGQVWEDPSINRSQPSVEYGPGDYVRPEWAEADNWDYVHERSVPSIVNPGDLSDQGYGPGVGTADYAGYDNYSDPGADAGVEAESE